MWYFLHVLGWILDIFEDFSILTEKQRMKPKNLTSWKNFASFDTLIVTESAKVVEIEIISKIVSLAMILKSNNPMCNRFLDPALFIEGCSVIYNIGL